PSFWVSAGPARRALVKLHALPEAAFNERLAYALGHRLGLLVNEVQIGLWEGRLATLHHDVGAPGAPARPLAACEPNVSLALAPSLAQMAFFDRLIANADREYTPHNALVTDHPTPGGRPRPRLHLIDHAATFGCCQWRIPGLIGSKLGVRELA